MVLCTRRIASHRPTKDRCCNRRIAADSVKNAAKAIKTARKSAISGVSSNFARRLSYQAWQSRRNVRMSDMPVCGDRQFVIDF
jgi:hypothetical protein